MQLQQKTISQEQLKKLNNILRQSNEMRHARDFTDHGGSQERPSYESYN